MKYIKEYKIFEKSDLIDSIGIKDANEVNDILLPLADKGFKVLITTNYYWRLIVKIDMLNIVEDGNNYEEFKYEDISDEVNHLLKYLQDNEYSSINLSSNLNSKIEHKIFDNKDVIKYLDIHCNKI